MPTQTFFDLKEEKKNRILDAARRVFFRDTYDKISIQDIIKEAQIPRGSFYQYFEDKDDLLLYCIKEFQRKSLNIIYQDNMDYYWNALYNEHPERRKELPWSVAAIEQTKSVLTEDEFNFAMHLPKLSDKTMRSVHSNAAMLLYPLLLKHLKNANTIINPENLDFITFLFSYCDLLSYEYAALKDISIEEAFQVTRPALCALYETFFDNQSSKENISQLHSLSSLHLLSSSGLDMTLALTPGSTWEFKNANDLTHQKIQIMTESLFGHLLINMSGMQPCSRDSSSTLTITTDAQGNAICSLALGGNTYNLEKNLTVLGTARDGTRLCIIDNGKYLL